MNSNHLKNQTHILRTSRAFFQSIVDDGDDDTKVIAVPEKLEVNPLDTIFLYEWSSELFGYTGRRLELFVLSIKDKLVHFRFKSLKDNFQGLYPLR